jgi:hypothetical protein
VLEANCFPKEMGLGSTADASLMKLDYHFSGAREVLSGLTED